MAFQSMEQGIQAIQNGNREEGARLLRIALRDEEMTPQMRAVGLMWLAETHDDTQFKIDCYKQALDIDPTNYDVQQRLSYYMAAQLPPNQQGGGDTGSQQVPPVQTNTSNTQPQQNPFGQQPVNNPNLGDSQQFFPQQGNSPYGQQSAFPTQQQPQNPSSPQQNPYQQQPSLSDSQQFFPQQGIPQQNPFGQQPMNNPNLGDSQQIFTQQGNSQPYQPTFPTQSQPVQPNTPAYGMSPVQPTQSGAQQGPPYAIQGIQRSVGISGGPNGEGTGILITQDGIIATTRHVAGGEENVKVLLANGHRLPGQVIRSFPEFDLSFIKVNASVPQVLTASNNPMIADNTPIVAIAHNGQGQRSQKRATKQQIPMHWIPTLIEELPDAGGDPIFDDQNHLIGMLTRNASRASGFVMGLHITKIYQMLEFYRQEVQQQPDNRVYCRHCGTSSRAAAFGGFYCEVCGAVLPYAQNIQRFPQPKTVALYGENMHRQCPNCSSQVGYYDSKCLRCGYDISRR